MTIIDISGLRTRKLPEPTPIGLKSIKEQQLELDLLNQNTDKPCDSE